MDGSVQSAGKGSEEEPLAAAAETAASRPQAGAGPKSKQRTKATMLLVTACLVLEWFRMGLYQDIVGPTLPFLKNRIGSDYSSVTQALSGKAIGLVVGATLGGIFEDKLLHASSLIICVGVTVSACWIAALPFAYHIGLYWAAFTTIGVLEGATNIFGQGLLLTMWQAKAAGPLQLLHFGFGCGSCIMPLIVSLFFPKEDRQQTGARRERLNGSCVDIANQSTSSWNSLGGSNASASWLQVSAEHTTATIAKTDLDKSLVPYAYILLAVFGAMCAFLFGALFVAERCNRLSTLHAKPTKAKISLKNSFRLQSCLPHSHIKVMLLLALIAAFCALLAATDRTFGIFIYIYAKDELCFDDAEAVALNSAFWGVFTSGRVVGFFVAHYVHPKFMLPAEVLGMAACSLVLAIFKGTNDEVTWVFCLGTALFMGPVFPSVLAWANRYINVTGMVITLIILGVAAGVVSCQVVIGYFLERHGAGAVIYFAAGQAGLLIVLVIVLQAIAYTVGDRFCTSGKEVINNMQPSMATFKDENNAGQCEHIDVQTKVGI